jgi:hypothetical protein
MLSQAVTGRIAERMQNSRCFGNGICGSGLPLRGAAMSKEKPNDDPRQQTDWKNTRQTDQPWKGPVEKEQRPGGPPPDLEKWHEANTH